MRIAWFGISIGARSFFFPFFNDAFAGGDFDGCGLGFPPGGNRRANSFVVSLVASIMLVMVANKSVEQDCGAWESGDPGPVIAGSM